MEDTLAGRTLAGFKEMLLNSTDLELLRTAYTVQVGKTFGQMAGMEDGIINAMSICDLVLVGKALGADSEQWKVMAAKQQALRDSTLGSLIKILEKHNIVSTDLSYLRWVKERRDFFVHRFYHDGAWPGYLDEFACAVIIRRLRCLELIFWRAERRIWKIFLRAHLMEAEDLGEAGVVLWNVGAMDRISGN